ncbi:GNAT family N-acetyltransferase [Rugamonas apoptosis]|uniref:GNAT family N-acetyltransferase n=1 Tax=Rugamonas apoptosis TaxID=2758570 RepID=A0A7W2FES3_9BURK|nr:GNAT family N-acetyltransferase [Rugamonas apoptosis]MBA5690401.1 GNAT family N-acetyltransferase [Rugamonas apoptosis]
MTPEPMLIRPMHAQELDTVLDWAAEEGWNPGLNDAACFHAADPGGFLLGVVDGEPVASIFAVQYGTTFGFIGGYLVRPAWRGRGHGMALWRAGMARLAGRNVGLDGVVAQQGNYAKSGFHLAHRNIRYEAYGRPGVDNAAVPLASLPIDDVHRYDRACFPDERSRFLQCWITQPDCIAVGIPGAQGVAAYAVLRPCRLGYKIGPLFAETAVQAETLFLNLLGQVTPGVPVYLDVPEANAAAMSLAARHQLRPCFETARMYTRGQPAMDMARQYGITSFELG